MSVNVDKTSERFEVFMPEYSLQGDKIPFYVRWNKQKIKIRISFTNDLQIEELYNVPSDGISISDGEMEIKKFQTPGYLGGRFRVNFDRAIPDKYAKVTLRIIGKHGQVYNKDVNLFRPSISAKKSDQPIKISYFKDSNKPNVKGKPLEKPVIKNQILLTNSGNGTGVISLEIMDGSSVEYSKPEEYENFINKLRKDLGEFIESLTSEFPHLTEMLRFYADLILHPLPLFKELNEGQSLDELKQTHNWIEDLEHTLETNEKFRDKFFEGILGITLKNISVVLDLRSFLAYLDSIAPNKILIDDPFRSVHILKGKSTLKAAIKVTDLLRNSYDLIELEPIEIESDKDCILRIYELVSISRRK